ncbi:MAG: thiamine phosphate synthase [Deltaproteobacteria bacterium]|nr:thiamine phosphate synthase [Deltaproteobacteria bacterium]MDQ3296609.1 thiamine phosphate synthase [Myxococcota bacterium]
MRAADVITGFYAVLDRDDEALARVLVGAGGARVLQIRLKPRGSAAGADARDVVRVARMARQVCDEVGAALVINDRVDIALAVGADGVHLGQTDLPLADARRIAGDRLWIGVSTHDVAQVRAACAGGADYLGFGPIFATATKASPDAVQGLDRLRAAVEAAGQVPIVAIGGITSSAASSVYETGAAAICAIGAVLDEADVGAAARALARR